MSEKRATLEQAVFALLNLAVAAPVIYLMLGLPLLMRSHGWSVLDIGIFQLMGLPAVFKLLLGVPVEIGKSPGKHYRKWAFVLGFLYVVNLLALALIGPGQPRTLFVLALGAVLLANWIDIPVSALAIKLLPAESRMLAGALRSAALFASSILGGGLMLVLATTRGWEYPFVVMAILLGTGISSLALLPDKGTSLPLPGPPLMMLKQISGFFKRPGAWAWTVLLLLHFPFVSAAWVFAKPLLLDQGLGPVQVAWAVGVAGGVAGSASSLFCSWFVRRAGVHASIVLFTVLNGLGIAAMALALSLLPRSGFALVAAMLFLAISVGGSAALGFGLTMHYARPHCRAVDYGLQASLVTLSRLMVAPLAGWLQSMAGYSAMLWVLAVAALGASVIAIALRQKINC